MERLGNTCHNLLHLEFELDAEQADPVQTSLKLLFKLLTAALLIFGFFFPVIT